MVGIKKTKKRKDIVIKAVNTGCAVFVRLTDLHQKEALRQLSDTSFHAKVDKDLTFINQNIVKNAISDLLTKQELLATAKISPVTLLELCVFTFYLKSTNLTSQADPSFLPAVVHRIHFQLFRKNYGTYVKTLLSYIKDSQHALEVFRDFNFLGQNKLIFTMDISSLYSHSQQWRSRGPQIFFRSTHC